MPDASFTAADSQGATFTASGITTGITSIKVKNTRSTVDASHLGMANGAKRNLQAAPLIDGATVTVEWIGSNTPTVGVKGAITSSIGNASGNAICEEYEITAAVGELLKGTATFRLVD